MSFEQRGMREDSERELSLEQAVPGLSERKNPINPVKFVCIVYKISHYRSR